MQGVLHWVGQPKAGQEPACFEARLYDRLFSTQTPGSKKKKVEDGQESAVATGQAAPTRMRVIAAYLSQYFIISNHYTSIWYTEIPDRLDLIMRFLSILSIKPDVQEK